MSDFDRLVEQPDRHSEFLIVEWQSSRVFAKLQNVKNVKLNDIVSACVNDKKDTGRVIFTGKTRNE
jgi:hypothetical protein